MSAYHMGLMGEAAQWVVRKQKGILSDDAFGMMIGVENLSLSSRSWEKLWR